METTQANGQAPEAAPAVRMIKFGSRETQVVHPDIADEILTTLFRVNPRLFGRLLQEAMVPALRKEPK